jgi:O-methyltransferase involved in polyketide biosynthesis
VGETVGKVRFTEDQSTNLATLYGRALDARSAAPILGDPTAQDAVRRIDHDFARFRIGIDQMIAIASRGKVFDDLAADFLREHPDATVLHLGAGLDSRHARLAPPDTVRWFDIDFPEVMALRAEVYPDLGHAIQVASSVTDLGWLEQVPTDRPALVIAEGLTMYLPPERGAALLRALAERLPAGEMVLDFYSRTGIRLQKLNPVLRRAKATLRWGIDDPRDLEPLGVTVVDVLHPDDLVSPQDVRRLSPATRLQVKLLVRIPMFRRMGRLLRLRF